MSCKGILWKQNAQKSSFQLVPYNAPDAVFKICLIETEIQIPIWLGYDNPTNCNVYNEPNWFDQSLE